MSDMKFDPNKSIVQDISNHENAVIVPFGEGTSKGMTRPAGAFMQDGTYIKQSQCLRSEAMQMTSKPGNKFNELFLKRLTGRWLYGGMLYDHFGHLLVESTSRFWALAHIIGPIDGIVYIPKERAHATQESTVKNQQFLSNLLGVPLRIMALEEPTQVDMLIIAKQGFGLEEMAKGTPEFREFAHENFFNKVLPEGSDKIYISRSKLDPSFGRYLGERQIEAFCAAEGYRVFHPQLHSIEDQVAQYKNAKYIIGSDGSSFHLAAFFLQLDAKVAVIKRRYGHHHTYFTNQIEAFAKIKPQVIDAVNPIIYAQTQHTKRQSSSTYTTLDLDRMLRKLTKRGYFSGNIKPPKISQKVLEQERQKIARSLGLEDLYVLD